MAQGKMLNLILIGAVAGFALSFIDKNTRTNTLNKSKKVTDTFTYYKEHPDELKEKATSHSKNLKEAFSKLREDATHTFDKINEIKDLSGPLQELLSDSKNVFSETKEAFVKTKDDVVSVANKTPSSNK